MLRKHLQPYFALCLILWMSACGGGGSGGASATPRPTVQLMEQYGSFYLNWEKSSRPSQVTVQATINGTPTSKSFPTPVGNDMVIYFTGTLPEVTPVTFGFQFSDGSPEVTVLSNSGPLPATQLIATGFAGASVNFKWTKHSLVADQVRVDRAPTDNSGQPTGPFTQVALLDGNATSCDGGVGTEAANFRYKVTYLSRGIPGPAVISTIRFPSAFTVTGLTVTPTPLGPKLQWTNHSAHAVTHVVYRASVLTTPTSYRLVGYASPGATEYLDSENPTGSFTYWVVTKVEDGSTSADSTHVPYVSDPVGPGPALHNSVLELPVSNLISRQSSGWYLKSYAQPEVLIPTGTSWTSASFPQSQFAYPFVLEDGQRRPHMVAYMDGLITHVWLDGASWHSETIAQRRLEHSQWANNFQFRLDSNGALNLIWQFTANGQPAGVEYATNAGGAWRIVALPGTAGSIYGCSLDVGDSGQAYVLLSMAGNGFKLVTIPPGGSPVVEAVPAGVISSPFATCLVEARSGKVSVFYDRFGASPTIELRMVEKSNSGWIDLLILTRSPSNRSNFSYIARNADSSRTAILLDSSKGLVLATNSLGYFWDQKLVGLEAYGPYTMGFDATDKFFLGVNVGLKNPGTSEAKSLIVFYQE